MMSDEQAHADLEALEQSGRRLPLELTPREAWQLLAALQGASQNLALPIDVIGYARTLGLGIEGRLCQSPAMKAAAARGWERAAQQDPEPERERPKLLYNKPAVPDPEPEPPKAKRRKPQ
jgi:hypothetical protein